MLKNTFAACFLIALSFLSCTKDELTRPVQAELVLEMVNDDTDSKKKLLKVDGGRFLIREISFAGDRENGENYFFTRQFTDTLVVSFSRAAAGRIFSFEMPQGIYSRINISMGLPTGKEEQVGVELPSISVLRGGVELQGTYKNTHDIELPFVFVYTLPDEFKFTAKNAEGAQQIIVKDKGSYKASLKFNPQQWMELINARMLQSAKPTLINGVSTIIISKTSNEAIFNLLSNRIEKSAELNFE